ncbi:hypothetical protein M436DRAFT_68020 [Aureobasidium namibiae CBS 147.97]|uniref:Uncharacterized protein n=1 Tax=Aureobasidium namibiae CBS 147.97 TaxID=1043004 RepID=A0A074WAC3_9PEZI
MSANTPPTFEPFGRLPSEIRSMIFSYMVRNTIKSHLKPHDNKICIIQDESQSQSLDTGAARAHLITSPWVTLNKQYCAEYLEVFVREAELRTCFSSQRRASPPRHSNSATYPLELCEPEKVLRLISHRFNIAGPHAGIETSSKKLMSRINGVCFSYQWPGLYFRRGFGTIERRQYPDRDFLKAPLRLQRQYHEDSNIPSNRLSIEINYGDPSSAFLKCLEYLDPGMSDPHTISFKAVQARIQVDDHDTSVAAIEKELEILREAVGDLIEKLRSQYSMRHELELIRRLEDMIDRDIILLQFQHLRAVDQVTKFWKAPDGEREAIELAITLPPLHHPVWGCDLASLLFPHQPNDNDRGASAHISVVDDDEVELDNLSLPTSNHHETACVIIDNGKDNQDDPDGTTSIHPPPQAAPPLPSCCGLRCILM